MISRIQTGSTQALGPAITSARLSYAQEREDFHDFFDTLTVPRIQAILRSEPGSREAAATRSEVVDSLFEAQQQSPHSLWTLLLVQACEPELVKRRFALGADDDATLDALVLRTFLAALEHIPHFLAPDEVRIHVLTRSARALSKAVKRKRRSPQSTHTQMGQVEARAALAPCEGDHAAETAPEVG